MKKERFLARAAMLLVALCVHLSGWAQNSVSTITTSENITKKSTVYAGEVVVDGVTQVKYLYSGDMSRKEAVINNLLSGLQGMADDDFATLLNGLEADAEASGLALCSDAGLTAAMDANWSSAQYVGALYFADKTVASETNSNLYDLDEGFKAALDAQVAARAEDIETLADAEKCIVTHLDSRTVTDVYYTIESGQVVRHSDTNVIYDSEATTVIYTRVELETASAFDPYATPLTFEAAEDGTINILNPNGLTIEYNKNGVSWTASNENPISIAVAANDVVQFRGDNQSYCLFGNSGEQPTNFTATNDVYVYGNVMSLVSSTDFATLTTLPELEGKDAQAPDNTFAFLFSTPGDSSIDPVINTTIHNHPTKDIVLPATGLTSCCYMYMFARCQGLTRAPELPATTLTTGCYHQMFCSTGIERAPVLSAANIVDAAYSSMFDGCTNLNYVKCLATSFDNDWSTDGWLTGVAATGTFVKALGMEDWKVGPEGEWNMVSGIPEGWTIVNASEETEEFVAEETPLTFEALEAGTVTVSWGQGATDEKRATLDAIQYKLNNGEWTDVTWETPISLAAGDVISFRGNNGTCYNEAEWAGFHIECSKDCYVYGNMMSLIDKDNFATNTTLTKSYTFFRLFERSDYEPATTIKNHPTKDIVLPATTLTYNCYDGLFSNCQSITRAPELPATTLAEWCYIEMFSGTGITVAPALPATTLANGCYGGMFSGCASLVNAPELPATTLAEDCYHRMFENCTSLQKAPVLPAPTLFGQVYGGMFDGCTSLNYVKCLAVNIVDTNHGVDATTNGWLANVAPTGTFVKAYAADWSVKTLTGEQLDGIPAGWTAVNNTESVTLNRDEEGNYWATYYNSAAGYTADENTTVYTAKVSSDKSKVVLTEVSDKTIPAGNAVVLKSTEATATMTYAEDATGTLDDNDLQGSATDIATPDNTYMLVKGDSGVGFYHWTEANIPAGRGYLTLTTSGARSFLPVGEETTTSIDAITTNVQTDATIYDLTGRPVTDQPRKGIYVKNGKKIIIK